MGNPFRSLRDDKLARQAAEAEAGSLSSPVSAKGRNLVGDGLGGVIRPDAATNEAAAMLVKLTTDRARLKQIQGTQAKIAAKADIVPEYRDWLTKLLDDPDQLEVGAVNDVLAMLTIWYIDIGDIGFALDLAELVLAKDVPMPSWFDRTAGCAITEGIATAALAAVGLGEAFDRAHLDHLDGLINNPENPVDMPDEVRAKLFKAMAMLGKIELNALTESGDAPDGVAGQMDALLADIGANAKSALALHNGCGVKKLIEKVELLQKNIEATRQKSPA
jgi:hypothetical protein